MNICHFNNKLREILNLFKAKHAKSIYSRKTDFQSDKFFLKIFTSKRLIFIHFSVILISSSQNIQTIIKIDYILSGSSNHNRDPFISASQGRYLNHLSSVES